MGKSRLVREWIIFAICLGAGAHIILGMILHAPESWPLSTAWVNGILLSLSLYVLVQVIRSLYWLLPVNQYLEGKLIERGISI